MVLVVYAWTAPLRYEQALQTASLATLESASQRDPNNQRIWYYLAKRLQQAGQIRSARYAFQRAAAGDANDADLWLAWAATAGSEGDNAEAAAVLRLFLKDHPADPRMHLALGRLFQANGSHELSYQEALAVTRLTPGNAVAWKLVGEEALKLNGKTGEAEAAMRRAVRQNPGDWESRLRLADVLFKVGRMPEALPCYREAVRLAPERADTHLGLGKALLSLAHSPAQIEEARESLLQARQLQADNPTTDLYIGKSYMQERRWKEAENPLERAARLAPDNADIPYLLSRLYRQLGDTAAAERAIQLHAELMDYQTQQETLGERIRAVNDPHALLKLARLYAAHGELTRAVAVYRSLLALTPNSTVIRQELAGVESRGDHSRH